MVLQSDTSFRIRAVTGPLVEFRRGYIGAPLVVKQLTVYSHYPIEDLRQVAVLNDDFKLVPLASEFSRAFWSGIDIIKISCAVLVNSCIWVTFCGIGPVI